ncbi:MAG: T9SS type A sorting domain-containing protein [bacterium]
MQFVYKHGVRLFILFFILIAGMAWPGKEAKSQNGATISIDTESGYTKSNQSKVFYHDGKWWALAHNVPDNRWYIWKYDGGVWTKTIALEKSTTLKYDALLNSASDKLYVMGSHHSSSEFWRFTYSSATDSWTKDSGFKVNPSFLNTDQANPVSLVQAKNGDLWIFRIESNTLQAKRSADGGATWSAVINIKTGLTTANGTTDAVAFTSSGNHFVGVVYGEVNGAVSKYGFLRHQDGAADDTWPDETASLTYFGSERGNNQLSAIVDGSNNIYVLTQNGNAGGSDPPNTLYKRAGAGSWQKFKANTSVNWGSPALAFDASGNKLYVMGINSSSQEGEYKTCVIGLESTLEAAAASILFSGSGSAFTDLSAPPSGASVGTSSGLMVSADNDAADDIWYNLLAITNSDPVTIGAITVSATEANANATYTIPLTLSDAGALTVGSGTITLIFPSNTFVPASIVAGNITVNGTPCTTVASNEAARQVTITTPVNLSNSQTFSVVINAGAGLLNPTLVGAYQLNAFTSAQPTLATSSNYNLTPATTSVTPATVSLTASEPDSCSNYTIAFNLGAQGRMVSGVSTFTVTFNAATQVANGNLTVVMVNGVAATATGNSVAKTVDITLPAAVPLTNNAAVSLSLPSSAVCNPSALGNFTLTVFTSVEGTAVTSNPYKIIERVVIGTVTVNPASSGVNASYTIPLTLANNGALAANVDFISFRFPAGTIVPDGIAAGQITVAGTPAITASSSSLTREVQVTTPVNLANSQNFSVVFSAGAGLSNPSIAGAYILQAWTSVQPSAANSPAYLLEPGIGGSPISTTTRAGYRKSNQSKVFYYNFQWWAIAFEDPENRWYIWKYDGATWTKDKGIDKGLAFHYDVLVDASAKKLYMLASHKASTKIRRYAYTGSSWSLESNYPVTLADFPNVDGNNPVSLVLAKNGDLWIFRVDTNRLQAKRSSDGGKTWSATVDVKTGLNTNNGTVDAVAFTQGGMNYVGVAYGEVDSPSPKSLFGFLLHKDGDPDNVWNDESSSLTFFGIERAINYVNMTVDASNNVHLLTRVVGGANGDPRNTLYKRSSSGSWSKYKVNIAPNPGWKAPVLAIDGSSNTLFLMGVHNIDLVGEYKTCPLGEEATLDTATVKPLFSAPGTAFDNPSSPAAHVSSGSGLMVCAENTTANDIYFRHIILGGSTPLVVGNVGIVSNETNANATYTVPLTLSANGALDAGIGVLNFIFPSTTFIKETMPASSVLVNGVPATSVIANNTTKLISVTTPVNLSNNQTFSVVFDSASGAGLLNPILVGLNYRLTAWTSSQPTQVQSPPYSIVQATTGVMPATVIPFPTSPDSVADYTVQFNLGPHGRLLASVSTVTLKFDAMTTITGGPITGAKINNLAVTGAADAVTRQITLTAPTGAGLSNNSAVIVFVPKPVVKNPILAGNYNLFVSTSAETTMVASNPYEIIPAANIGAPIPGTTKAFDRPNQSKMFYHGGFWWVTGQSKVNKRWYLYKFDGLTWTQTLQIDTAPKSRPDCILDASNNKAYILLPGGTTKITRLSYSGGNWTVEAGYPYTINDFDQGSDRGINLVRAQNGDLWIFNIVDSTLIARHSSNNGQTWSADITLKSNLHYGDGLTDAVVFSHSGSNHIGVGYAENSAPGSIYGFLRHKDSDPDNVWTDETAAIPQFTGTTSDDHISMTVHDNEIFMAVKTNGGGPTTANIGLLHRGTGGTWNQYPIILSSGWTRPIPIIDESSDRLYIIGSRESSSKIGEMKSVALGDYGALISAPIDTIFMNEADRFFNASVSAHSVNNTMHLMVCNGNETRDELWYNLIPLSGIPKPSAETSAVAEAEEDFDGVQAFPNPFNPQTSFRFKVKAHSPVKLQIFNLTGQLVRTLVDADLAPGVHVRRWNGRGQDGRPAASGIYLYRLQVGKQMMTGRVQMLK